MKRSTLALMLAFVMVFGFIPTMANAETGIKIWVEGDYISMDVEPFIEEGRTLVPVRFVTEALGFEVTWHANEKKVTFTNGTDEIMMMIGSLDATLNGEAVKLYKEPQIKGERTFVPVRDVAEKFGKVVDWDPMTKTVVIGEGYFEPKADDIVDVALGSEDFTVLVAALQKAELVDTLKGEGPFTVFAPTNAAFAQLLAELNISAEDLLGHPDLSKVLTYHVVAGKVMSTDLVDGMEADTVNGQKIKVDLKDGVKINTSSVSTPDLEATNGVIHVIDKVLVPDDFKLN